MHRAAGTDRRLVAVIWSLPAGSLAHWLCKADFVASASARASRVLVIAVRKSLRLMRYSSTSSTARTVIVRVVSPRRAFCQSLDRVPSCEPTCRRQAHSRCRERRRRSCRRCRPL